MYIAFNYFLITSRYLRYPLLMPMPCQYCMSPVSLYSVTIMLHNL